MSESDITRSAKARGPRSADPAPARVGRYVVERELGRGGMGVVYLARDTRLDREVALKALPPSIAINAAARERFEREARLLAALEHPNVASLYGIEDAEGASYLVLQRIEGQSVAERLRGGPMGVPEALDLARQVAAGLAAAHRRGITHCDLKPANVMLGPDGRAKVVDFGLARRHRRPGNTLGSTAVGAGGSGIDVEAGLDREIIGTPAYMSPEQAIGDPLDPRTDVWSFGCLLVECLSARPAFAGRDTTEVIERVLGGVPDLAGLPADLPAPLAALIRSCLSRDREDRPADMARVRAALDEVSVDAAESAEVHLPRALTAFIGREAELARVTSLLGTSRLVTLTGAAGCGKTRLAIEAARLLPLAPGARRWFVGLASVLDASRVGSALLGVLGVREDASRPAEEAALLHLRSQQGVLILDNCEHLLDRMARIAESILESCEGVRVLCTSREALGVPGETAVRVPSLAHPAARSLAHASLSLEELQRQEGIRFFVERAREARPDFALDAENAATVVAIVERLDGIPLALELAAARLRVLAPDQVLARLSDRFRLLTGGSRTALERHQTLRGALEWSHDLLREDERRCLRELAVFTGGFRLEEATSVCSGDEFEVLDLVTSLVNKSLVQVELAQGKAPRYRLLESVRQHAGEKLDESGLSAEIRRRHLACYARLARELSPDDGSPPARDAVRALEAEQDNLRGALEWAIADSEPPDTGLALAAALGMFWDNLGLWRESREVLTALLAREDGARPSRDRASCMRQLATATFWLGHLAEAEPLAEEAERQAREVGDERLIARVLTLRAMLPHGRGQLPAAREGYFAALAKAREVGDPMLVTNALLNISTVSRDMADRDEALRCATEGLELARRSGLAAAEARLLRSLGMLAWDDGRLDEAAELIERARDIHVSLRQRRDIVRAGLELAHVTRMRGNLATAREMYLTAIQEARETASGRDVVVALASAGTIDRDLGDFASADSMLREALRLVMDIGALSLAAGVAGEFAALASRRGEALLAARVLGAVELAREATGRRLSGPELEEHEAHLAGIREALGEEELDRAWALGRDAGLEATCHAILSEKPTPS